MFGGQIKLSGNLYGSVATVVVAVLSLIASATMALADNGNLKTGIDDIEKLVPPVSEPWGYYDLGEFKSSLYKEPGEVLKGRAAPLASPFRLSGNIQLDWQLGESAGGLYIPITGPFIRHCRFFYGGETHLLPGKVGRSQAVFCNGAWMGRVITRTNPRGVRMQGIPIRFLNLVQLHSGRAEREDKNVTTKASGTFHAAYSNSFEFLEGFEIEVCASKPKPACGTSHKALPNILLSVHNESLGLRILQVPITQKLNGCFDITKILKDNSIPTTIGDTFRFDLVVTGRYNNSISPPQQNGLCKSAIMDLTIYTGKGPEK